MGKYHVEVCVASARGLRRSFLRSQWFAVAWIDPERKYCTKVDARGGTSPVWNTKFVASFDGAVEDAALHVEVYGRETLFLRERLEGTASISLREFLTKLDRSPEPGVAESGSFQLRKKGSTKPRGFVDLSLRISDRAAGEGLAPHAGREGAFTGISTSISEGNPSLYSNADVNQIQPYSYPPPPPQARPQDYYSQPQFQPNTGRPSTPPPPPPPSNTGFLLPPFAPTAAQEGGTYWSMPGRTSAGARGGTMAPGFGMGAAGGALAAGAFLFGDDFLNAMDYSSGLDGGSVTISANSML
ncbi:uncharacterized protein LOC116254275 isoform X2 [Nymphaea colorata]|uniref:uncharacterized protein LOC116254275 isoform X2 n=1 Tax=Nymphaea colorata TaxID=210225 RepID=UPI00129EE1EA|nr:uncharacterized protein LOC116254275 isoform X2 [Nymphaea colorata]